MPFTEQNHNQKIVTFFEQKLPWWTDVYREDLPQGFFSFEMRSRLKMVTEQLTVLIQKMDNPNVLECGCGPGDMLEQLAPLRCNLTGVDINQRYLGISAKKVPRATLLDGNIEQLPFPDESFDIVYAVGVLMYVENDQLAINEMARVTKKGGFVMISVPNYYMLHLLIDPFYLFNHLRKIITKNKIDINPNSDECRIRRYSLKILRKMCKNTNIHEINSQCSSFGPIRFWRKKILPLCFSIKISKLFVECSKFKLFSVLNHVGNQLNIVLKKS